MINLRIGFGATVKIAPKNVSRVRARYSLRKSGAKILRRGVENYFDLERTRRVIFLFGIHFMLVLKSSDGSSNRHGSCSK